MDNKDFYHSILSSIYRNIEYYLLQEMVTLKYNNSLKLLMLKVVACFLGDLKKC